MCQSILVYHMHWWKWKFYEKDVDEQDVQVLQSWHHNIEILLLGRWVNLVGQQCCGVPTLWAQRQASMLCWIWSRCLRIGGWRRENKNIKGHKGRRDEVQDHQVSKDLTHRLCFQIFTIVQTSIVPWLRACPMEWSALNNVFRIIISNQWLFTIFLDIIKIIIDPSYS